jgi:predicted CxxxxCH...CXXCH cytochrome family protein
MMRINETVKAGAFALVMALLSALSGCEPHALHDGFGAMPEECLQCHTEDGPLDSRRRTQQEATAYGAEDIRRGHARHRDAGIGCEVCHRVPEAVGDIGHIDGLPAEVRFSGIAVSGGLTPRWNRDTKRCEGTYCHGGGKFGGSINAPSFADSADLVSACDSCHGYPPAKGAHPEHARAGLACVECHAVPATVSEEGHIDAPPAEISFGKRARLRGAAPVWRAETKTCEGTYCHGATLTDEKREAPQFLPAVTATTPCNSCHGFPPPDTHSASFGDCYLCHPSTVTPENAIDDTSGTHINGVRD